MRLIHINQEPQNMRTILQDQLNQIALNKKHHINKPNFLRHLLIMLMI